MAFVSNVGKNVTEEELRRKIPEDQRENVRRVDLTSSAGVAVITLKTAEVTKMFITEVRNDAHLGEALTGRRITLSDGVQ